MPASAEQRGSVATAGGTRTRVIVVAAAVVIVAVIVGITVLATSSSGSSNPSPTHFAYRQLFNSAVVGQTKIAVLSQWPKPYQVYTAKPDQCFEWYDNHVALYNLCFLNGVLHAKDLE
jgi:hypothetical protein